MAVHPFQPVFIGYRITRFGRSRLLNAPRDERKRRSFAKAIALTRTRDVVRRYSKLSGNDVRGGPRFRKHRTWPANTTDHSYGYRTTAPRETAAAAEHLKSMLQILARRFCPFVLASSNTSNVRTERDSQPRLPRSFRPQLAGFLESGAVKLQIRVWYRGISILDLRRE